VGTGVAAGGVYSIQVSALSDGPHAITAKASGGAGNESVPSAALILTIDTQAPAVPSTPVLDPASDTGVPGDNRTEVVAPTFTGTATVSSTVRLFSDGILVGTGVATGGAYSIQVSALTDGPHAIT